MMKRKLKIAFGSFLLIASASVVAGVSYLESQQFADVIKRMISVRSPENFGVVGDFSNLTLHLFPPSIGLLNPKIKIEPQNISKLPIEGEIEAKEMRVGFAPIQMLSGTIRVSEIAVIGGAVQGKVGADVFRMTKKPKVSSSKLSWKDLFELQIEGFRFEDTYLNVEVSLPKIDQPMKAEFVVKHLVLKKEQLHDKVTFLSSGLVNAVKVELPKKLVDLPLREATQVQWNIEFSDQGLSLAPLTADFSGSRLNLNGKVTGNLLESGQGLDLEADATLETELGTFFLVNFGDDHWGGDAKLTARFKAALSDIKHTFRGSFKIEGNDLRWKDIFASTINGNGSLDLAKEKVDIEELVLKDNSNTSEPGVLKISHATIPFEMNEGFQAKVSLQNGDLHWLGGGCP